MANKRRANTETTPLVERAGDGVVLHIGMVAIGLIVLPETIPFIIHQHHEYAGRLELNPSTPARHPCAVEMICSEDGEVW